MASQAPTFPSIQPPVDFSIERIYLDPNNPRIAPEELVGYDDPKALFDAGLQAPLEARVRNVYDVSKLEDSIMSQGWVPIDSMLVWEHPGRPGHYVVVEGNTRLVALRTLRNTRLEAERLKLARYRKRPTHFQEELKEQEITVSRLEQVVADTSRLKVYPVAADSGEALQQVLPNLLGVRHITGAREWTPYATNLYILSIYERHFRQAHGPDVPLKLEDDIVKRVAGMVSLTPAKTRRNIQAASAFTHFRRDFSDRMPEGEKLTDEDHYFFELILSNAYPREQFQFGKDALRLSPEYEEALFVWSFSQPRGDSGDDNPNVFYKAESIRLWQKMAKYDAEKGTSFASQLNTDAPEEARPIRTLEVEFLAHMERRTPIDTLTALIQALKELKVDTLVSQHEHIAPILNEVHSQVVMYQKMVAAAAEKS